MVHCCYATYPTRPRRRGTLAFLAAVAALLSVPVAQAAVIPLQDPARGTLIKAYVVRVADLPIDDAELVTELQALASVRLAFYERPEQIAFVNDLPMSPTGKLQRQTLKAREAAKAPSPPASPAPPVLLP